MNRIMDIHKIELWTTVSSLAASEVVGMQSSCAASEAPQFDDFLFSVNTYR